MTGKKKKILTQDLHWDLPGIKHNLSRPSHIKDK